MRFQAGAPGKEVQGRQINGEDSQFSLGAPRQLPTPPQCSQTSVGAPF